MFTTLESSVMMGGWGCEGEDLAPGEEGKRREEGLFLINAKPTDYTVTCICMFQFNLCTKRDLILSHKYSHKWSLCQQKKSWEKNKMLCQFFAALSNILIIYLFTLTLPHENNLVWCS